MRATSIEAKNIGILEDVTIAIDKPLMAFYGEPMQGKTTILNCVRWVMGGPFPPDIIRHGAAEAFIQFKADDAGVPVVIRREFYRGKDQATKSREIVFTRAGVPVKSPVTEIKKFLNPFLLDQGYFASMSALERGRYLVQLFGVDTSEEDKAIAEAARKAQELRITVKAYGTIDTTRVEAVDVAAMQSELAAVR
jgi:DNA repair exonuclease SbcCD ATPase subunit